ncbi:DUF6069 family protein [Plantactinospora soyae]|uniref:Cell envelope biogenesis protein OmpA n=1 Tax=Plantactinospora soyae TaxID=1544732 RepID=A0A927R7S3_9ACTN|nr:DUF6069 family protein [Plantactinospora soyae]MBE1489749.1 hypothetical protein [Plantactinospora soyae]
MSTNVGRPSAVGSPTRRDIAGGIMSDTLDNIGQGSRSGNPFAPARKSLVKGGLVAIVVAAVATALIAFIADLAGISLVVMGAPLQLSGFAMLTVIFAGLGLILAVILARTVRRPRTVFVRTTIALTVLSLVPDLLVPAGTLTRLLLMFTHLVAAAIVIPTIARRLAD